MDTPWALSATALLAEETEGPFRFRVRGESMLPTLHPGDEVDVETMGLEGLQPGDLILVDSGGHLLLHRLLGIEEKGGSRSLRTCGDSRWQADPLHPERALLGRATLARRGDRTLRLSAGRWPAWRLRARMALWGARHQIRAILSALLVLLLLAVPVRTIESSVTLVSFEAEVVQAGVRVSWETASEVNNLGFYVWRSDAEDGIYERMSELIWAEGDLVGANYDWVDEGVEPDAVFYYELEDVSSSGGSTFWGPVSSAGDEPSPPPTAIPASPTPTHTPTNTSEPTSTFAPVPTFTPTPSPTSPPTHTPTLTPTRAPVPTSTSTPTRTPSATPTSLPTGKPSSTPSPSATASAVVGPPALLSLTPTTPSDGMAVQAGAPPLLALVFEPTPPAEPSRIIQSPSVVTQETVVALRSAENEVQDGAPPATAGAEEDRGPLAMILAAAVTLTFGGALGVLALVILGLVATGVYRRVRLRSD